MTYKLYPLIVSFLFACQGLIAQNYWEFVPERSLEKSADQKREIIPDAYQTLTLDYKGVTKSLLRAPTSYDKNDKSSLIKMDLPMPDGSFMTFGFFESSCFSPVLQEKFPHIRSYRGVALDLSGTQARIDIGKMGFHATINNSKEEIYIDPYATYDIKNYIVYHTKDHNPSTDIGKLSCGVEASHHDHSHVHGHDNDETTHENKASSIRKKLGTPVTKYVYRLALACTGQWGSIYGNVDEVMSQFNTAVNRLNMIFENEMGVKFELVDDNDKLIFFRDTEPYTFVNDARRLINQNTTVINENIGNAAYDIGHIFTVNCLENIGGLASLGSLCSNGFKGNGVSCVGSANVSNFMVSVTAHEIGHQLSAQHTWNNCPGNEDNISPEAAYEPGSGSTIMSYAGACRNGNNIVRNNDDYFHVFSLEQMYNHVESAGCGEETITSNNTPDISIPLGDDVVIPISTPFELIGEASDEDGDNMTYTWEQMDKGPSSQIGNPILNAPLFKSIYPGSSPIRLCPSLPAILNSLNPADEVLPTYSRDLTFRFIVRDNHPGVGTTVWEEIQFESTEDAGPFIVTSPADLSFAEIGSNYLVEWDVANTDNESVNCQFVDIFLSKDNGQTFDVILKLNTPNDGSESIVIPNEITNNGRIKVKASNNIFFNIGKGELIIRAPSEPGFYVDLSNNNFDICVPETVSLDINGTSFLDFDNPVQLEIIDGLPPNATYTFSDNPMLPDGSSTLDITLDPESLSDSYDLVLQAVSEDADTVQQLFTVNITGTDMSDLALVGPASGTANLGGTPTFDWAEVPNAASYTLEVSTSPSFGSTNIITETDILENTFTPPIVLDNSELYYWRVTSSNKCISEASEIFTFGTVTLACETYESQDLPRNISTGLPTVTSTIVVPAPSIIADVNIDLIKVGHGRARDLKATLISPSNTEVELFASSCAGANVDIGFDSDSPLAFGCPLNSGRIMIPQNGSLFDYQGEQAQGPWRLEIQDERAGEGGRFDAFVLELCGSVTTNDPFLVNNFVLEVPTGGSDRIFNEQLLSQDNDNGPQELLYTVVVQTTKGSVYIDGQKAEVGSTFTQSDIDNSRLRYVHEGDQEESDFFVFTVIDGQGGWIDLTRFDINMEDGFLSSIDEIPEHSAFDIFPNPANNILHIRNKMTSSQEWQMDMYNVNGQLIRNTSFKDHLTLEISDYESGVYIIQLSNGQEQLSHRVSIMR